MRVNLLSLESFYDNSLALDYLSGYAETQQTLREHDVKLCTLVQRADRSDASFWDNLYSDLGDIVGFNTYVWNIEASIKAAQEIKQRSPSTIVVMGGMEAAYTAPTILKDVRAIDFVVIGEGEVTFAELLERIIRGRQFEGGIPGLAYRGVKGNVISGGMGTTVQRLDDIPSPFLNAQFQARKLRDVLYESYRGCAFHCGFCLYHRDYTKQRYFSSERVAKDIQALRDAGCTHIRFVDSTFNIHRGRVKEILGYLDGVNADVSVEVSAEFFDSETIEMFPRAGIRHVDIGLQSTNRGALSTVNREWYREELFKQNIFHLRDHPALTLNVELIAGLPSDNYEGLKRSIDEAVSLWPDHISIYRLLGLKGTEVEKQKEKFGLIFSERPPYELIESTTFPRELMVEVELLTFSHLVLFNLGIGRYAFKYILNLTGKNPTLLYEEFWRFVLKEELYSQDEALLLSRFYAYGNRFDRDLPDGLEPLRVKDAVESFFLKSCIDKDDIGQSALAKELMDYGLHLALLDMEEEKARAVRLADDGDQLLIAPWCKKVRYSHALYNELRRQGDDVGDLSLEDISSVIFFVHPEFGPASLAIDQETDELVANFEGTACKVNVRTGGADPRTRINDLNLSDEAREAVEHLKHLHILTARLKTHNHLSSGDSSVSRL